MAEQGPTKTDIEAVFKRLRAVPTNKVCFDCSAKNPTWSSVTYGVFICLDCSAVHRSLGVHLTFVRSTQLDTNWSWIQLRNMQLGGNANAQAFFRQHNATSQDAQQKYNSRAAQLYREKLAQMSAQAMKIHGTRVNLESTPIESSAPEETKEVDFFDEQSHTTPAAAEIPTVTPSTASSKVSASGGLSNGTSEVAEEDKMSGPNVEAALNMTATDAQKLASQPRKSTIGQRKPASKLGARKGGGLGAQRVKADFSAIEKEAARNDQMRIDAAKEKTKAEQEESLASLQQVYQDMSLATKREEERMKRVDPKKAEQAERLGMGLGVRTGMSHSMFGEMKTIEQETPVGSNKARGKGGNSFRDSEIEDEFEVIDKFSMGPPKYRDSPFEDRNSFQGFSSSARSSGIDDLLTNNGKSSHTSSSSWENEFDKSKSSNMSSSNSIGNMSSSKAVSANYQYTPIDDTKAREKFGNAKAISSDMFFNDRDPNAEMQTTLQRFQGSSSISSADLFGGPQQSTSPRGYSNSSLQAPDLDEVRESVRQGVTKVAGRLSNLANNVMSSLQDRYT